MDAIYDENGFDKDGYDENGHDKNGYNKNGLRTSLLTCKDQLWQQLK